MTEGAIRRPPVAWDDGVEDAPYRSLVKHICGGPMAAIATHLVSTPVPLRDMSKHNGTAVEGRADEGSFANDRSQSRTFWTMRMLSISMDLSSKGRCCSGTNDIGNSSMIPPIQHGSPALTFINRRLGGPLRFESIYINMRHTAGAGLYALNIRRRLDVDANHLAVRQVFSHVKGP